MYRLTAVACRINPPLPNSIKGHMTYTASPVLVTNQLHSGESTFWEKVFVGNGKNLVRI